MDTQRNEVFTNEQGKTLLDFLSYQVKACPDKIAYTFLPDNSESEVHLTFHELDIKAKAIAALVQKMGIQQSRFVLSYPPGLDFITAFFGCLYSGNIPVPVYPPFTGQPQQSIDRLRLIISDVSPALILTNSTLLSLYNSYGFNQNANQTLQWVNTEEIPEELAKEWIPHILTEQSTALIQYTSGSTSNPKGVVLTHRNIIHNLETIKQAFGLSEKTVGVGWLPVYHDMGLIGNILQIVYLGARYVFMSPFSFLQKPQRWLQAISKYGGTCAGGPNFAYELCVKKITDENTTGLDLSTWELAYNGAEPVSAETIRKFCEKFQHCGFRKESFYPCYGMAEASLFVTGGLKDKEPHSKYVDKKKMETHQAVLVDDDHPSAKEVICCGFAWRDQEVVIINPETLEPCSEYAIGEIWTSGPNVSMGYWNHTPAKSSSFGAFQANNKGPYLRTGDLGFKIGHELFVTGRIKDVIIIRGRNYYPEDIEKSTIQCHPMLNSGVVIAFSKEVDNEEKLVIVCAIRGNTEQKQQGSSLKDEIINAVRKTISRHYQLEVYDLVCIKPASVPKTSSGKIQRSSCRNSYLNGSLATVWSIRKKSSEKNTVQEKPVPDPAATSSFVSEHEIQNWLIMWISERLKLPANQVNKEEAFYNLGLDSKSIIELSEELGRYLGYSLSPTLFFNYSHISSLTEYLIQQQTYPNNNPHSTQFLFPKQNDATPDEPIAVIGMSCRFPGGRNIQEFWELLRTGSHAITNEANKRWKDTHLPDSRIGWGGFLQNIQDFDPGFFEISPKEAAHIDPQQRLLLEVAWEALENAGTTTSQLSNSEVGVFVGISNSDYSRLHSQLNQELNPYSGTGNALSIAANRLSYWLNLKGPSLAIDTACSSSLVAIHQACQSLRSGECSTAIAGGVNLLLTPELSIIFSKAGMLAADGKCKTFDTKADGYVRGEGCGVVVLKRLTDAQNNNDRILGVIRGSAINQDGKSNGLTAPNGLSQEKVILKALTNARVSPHDITYIEAHGTGTSLGDSVELNALKSIFSKNRLPDDVCYISSVKTNIGHLESAAGIAGFIKTILCLQHKEIVQSLNFDKLDQQVESQLSPLRIANQNISWPGGSKKRICGISSFGFGGTNVHMITEEAPEVKVINHTADLPLYLFKVSAKSARALKKTGQAYYDLLENTNSHFTLSDLCLNAAIGRSDFEERASFIVSSLSELKTELGKFISATPNSINSRRNTGIEPIAFLFTGQGAQYFRMGFELYQLHAGFRQTINRCQDLLRPYLDKPLLDILFNSVENTSLINQARYSQPVLFALEYSLAEFWIALGIKPQYMIGHSLGEYAAACIAGVFSLEDGLKLVAARGRIMEELPENGEMISLSGEEQQIKNIIQPWLEQVSIAAFNSPRNLVLSGNHTTIAEIIKEIEGKIVYKKLNVSHAFHSSLMHPVIKPFSEVLLSVKLSKPLIPIISTVTGTIADKEMGTPEYWIQQIIQPVNFHKAIRQLNDDCTIYLEIGPRPVLSSFLQAGASNKALTSFCSLNEHYSDWRCILKIVAGLYEKGISVNWKRLYEGYNYRHLDLPNHPFYRTSYWVQPNEKNDSPGMRSLSAPTVPFIAHKADSPCIKEIKFENLLSVESMSYLQDHRISGRIIFPAAAFLEYVFQAARQLGFSGISIQDFKVNKALIMKENESVTGQLIVNNEITTRQFQYLSTKAGKKDWTLHCTGKFSAAEKPVVDPAALSNKKAENYIEIPTSEFYGRLEARGMHYGPAFQSVKKIFAGNGTSLGYVQLSSETIENHYHFHPVLLDSSFQVIAGALMSTDDNRTCLLVEVGQMELFDAPPPDVWVYCWIDHQPDSNEESLKCHLEIYSDSGDLIAIIKNVLLKVIRSKRTGKTINNQLPDNWTFIPRWEPVMLREPETNNYTSSWSNFLDNQTKTIFIEKEASDYVQQLKMLEKHSWALIVQALQQLGFYFEVENSFTSEELSERLGIRSSYLPLLNRFLEILSEEGIITRVTNKWKVLIVPQWKPALQQLQSHLPMVSIEQSLLLLCGSRLSEILRGETDVLQILFPNGDFSLLTELYQDSYGAQLVNTLVQKIVLQRISEFPEDKPIRILEIGAGVGGTTHYILPHLPPSRSYYLMTDISPLFLARAKEKFSSFNFLDVNLFNIEEPSASQGFRKDKFDFIIASNVLHATKNLDDSLNNLKGLLTDQGMLLLVEGMNKQRWLDLTFGLTSGWWRFDDKETRSDYPLLSGPSWIHLLEKNNFRTPQFFCPFQEEATDYPIKQGLIIAQASLTKTGNWIVLRNENELSSNLLLKLQSDGSTMLEVINGDISKRVSETMWMVDAEDENSWKELFIEIRNDFGGRRFSILDLGNMESADNDLSIPNANSIGTADRRFIALWKGLTQSGMTHKSNFWLLTQGTQFFNGKEESLNTLIRSTLWGIARSIRHEYQDGSVYLVDLPLHSSEKELESVYQLITNPPDGNEWLIRNIGTFTPVIKPVKLPGADKLIIKSNATYLVTGFGHLGLLFIKWLAANGATHLVIASRSGSTTSQSKDVIDKLINQGLKIKIVKADFSIQNDVDELFREIGENWPFLAGVFHTANLTEFKLLDTISFSAYKEFIDPKVLGAWHIHQNIKDKNPDFIVYFSSMISLLGAPGQSHYAAANLFLDNFSHYQRQLGIPAISIDFGLWEGGGALATDSVIRWIKQSGFKEMESLKAIGLFEQAVLSGHPQIAIAAIEFEKINILQNSLLKPLIKHEINGSNIQNGGIAIKTQRKLELLTKAEQKEYLIDHFKQLLASVAGYRPEDINEHIPLSQIGIDSLMALEIKNKIKSQFGLDINLMSLLEGKNLVELIVELLDQQTAITTVNGDHVPSLTTPDSVKANGIRQQSEQARELLTRVNDLSPQELEILLNQYQSNK